MMLIVAAYILATFPILESKEIPETVQRSVLAATVQILNPEAKKEGSGVLIGIREGQGFILTARHVVAEARQWEVRFFEDESYPKSVLRVGKTSLLIQNQDADLALLRVDLKGVKNLPKPLKIRKEALKEKEFLAFSSGGSGTASPTLEPLQIQGRKLLTRPDRSSAFFWQSREAPEEGRSGGPLVDLRGNLIGICSGKQEEKGYYTALEEIRSWLEKSDHAWILEEK